MKWGDAIDAFIRDWKSEGRINSPATERDYFNALWLLAEDAQWPDPRRTDREDVKHFLTRWPNPNSQRKMRSIAVVFFDWAMEEGYRADNPARQTRRPKPRPVNVYHPTRDEAQRMLLVAEGWRERWTVYLGVCAGLRNAELRGLRGRHFSRPGFVWVSEDIAKGGRERYVPIIGDLRPVADEICHAVEAGEYVLCSQRWRDVGSNTNAIDYRERPCSAQAIFYLVKRVAKRAGIGGNVTPHSMRRAFADMVEQGAGERTAQLGLGHASVGTTEAYLSKRVNLDRLADAFSGLTFGLAPDALRETEELAAIAGEAPTGIEPVSSENRSVEPNRVAPDAMQSQIARLIAAMRAGVERREAA